MAKEKSAHLSIAGLALACGITWGLSMIVAGWAAIFGWCKGFVEVMSSIYIGYDPSFIGAIIGGIWGFGDGFIAGLLVAFFYNIFRK